VISLFQAPITSSSAKLINKFLIYEILSKIQDGTWKDIIDGLRKIEGKKERKEYKNTYLPFFFPSCELYSIGRHNADAVQHTGIVAIDIDNTNPEECKDKLSKDPYLYAAFASSYGFGVCAMFVVDPPQLYGQDPGRSLGRFHNAAWDGLDKYLKERYGVFPDKSGKNISRARFVSYDDKMIGFGSSAVPFPVKLDTDSIKEIALIHDNNATPSFVIDILKNYITAEIRRTYFTRDNLIKAGIDVSGFAHDNVIRLSWFCGGFNNIITDVGRQVLAEHFISEMEGNPNFERSQDSRKWLHQYDKGTEKPLTIDDLPGVAGIEFTKQTIENGTSAEDDNLFRVECRSAIYKNKMSQAWIGENSAMRMMRLEDGIRIANEEVNTFGIKIKGIRKKISAMQFVVMCNAANVKYSESIKQPVDIGRDQHKALSKEALRSIVEEYTGVRFSSESTTEGYARIHEGEKFDPIKNYLLSIPKWDGHDYIKELSTYFETTSNEAFLRFLSVWLISTAKCALDDMYTNRYALVFTSTRQSIGKSFFFGSYLVPPFLYAEGVELNGRDGDVGRALASALIVNLEEFTAPKDVSRLKKIISQPSFVGRPAHGKSPELHIRKASFAVCTNDPRFLTDVSNTRFLCVSIKSINREYSKKIKAENIWAQAVAMIQKDPIHYSLSQEELDQLDSWNKKYIVVDNAEQFLNKYFIKADENTINAVLFTSAEMQQYVELRTGIRSHEKAYREAIKRLGWFPDDNGKYRIAEAIVIPDQIGQTLPPVVPK